MAVDFSQINTACLLTFGETVTYTNVESVSADLTVIWTEGASALERYPECQAIAFAIDTGTFAKGERITRNGKTYKISMDPSMSDLKDSNGGVNLVLRLAAQL